MRNITRLRKRKAKRGVSEIVAAVFMILIIFVAFAVFETMFNSFVSYQQTADEADQQNAQNQQTLLSSSMQFGSPVVASGASNPPTFNINSIATSTVQTLYTFENKLVYAQSLWWAFYSSGTAIVYQTSSDGITWSATATLTAVAGSTVSYGFSDVLLGSTLYFVLSRYHTGTNSFTLGDVPLIAGGSIGTVTTATIGLGAGYDAGGYNSITVDTSSSTYVWVALNVYRTTTTDTYVEVERCTTALACTAMDGTAPPTITSGTTTNDQIPMINDLSGGAISVVYANAGGEGPAFAAEGINFRTCPGGTATGDCQAAAPTWTGPAAATATTFYPEHSSSIAIGTTTYFAGSTATEIGTFSFALGSTATPTVTAISTLASGAAAPTEITEYGTGNTLGTGNVLQVYFGSAPDLYNVSTAVYGTWPTANTISTSETGLLGINGLENSTLSGLFWSDNTASPYAIRFAEANTQAYNPTQISPSTVDTSTTRTATGTSGENKLFYDLGLWWDFFSIGTGIDFATSSDGLTWSAPTSVITSATYTGAEYGSDFSLYLNGNTVYWALSSGGATGGNTANFDYNSGTLASTGTIAFGTTATIATTYATQGPISIGIDNSGNAWVALTTLTGATYHIEVYEHNSGAANTAWSTNILPTGFPAVTATAYSLITGLQTGSGAVLVSETTGTTGTGTLVIYSTTGTSAWTTSTWSTSVSPASGSYYALAQSSDTIVGSTLVFAGLNSSSISQTTGTLDYWTFTIGSSATSSDQVIESSPAAWQSAIGSDGVTIFLFDASVSTITYYYTSNLGATWSLGSDATYYEPSIMGLSGTGEGTMAITWTSGNPSYTTFTVRFASLSSLTVSNNGGSAVELTSLFVSNPTTNALVIFYDSTNSTYFLDYWVNPGSSVSVALSFIWTTTTSYEFTIGTSTGVVVSLSATSPS